MKKCSKCKQNLSLDSFNKDKYAKDGLQYHCRICKGIKGKKWVQDRNNPKCSKCNKFKKLEDFHKRSNRKAGIHSHCKECIRKAKKKYHSKADKELLWSKKLFRKYGITKEVYYAKLENQNYSCKICNTKTPSSGYKQKFCVDHCHETGQVRGLLCSNCNRALGLFKDSREVLNNAANYLYYYDVRKKFPIQ